MKTFISIAFLLTSFFIYAKDTKEIKVGITGSNPPFALTDSPNHYSGFDIDIMNEISKRIGVKFGYVKMTFENFFPSIENGSIDLAIDSIIITPTRQERYIFSIPYLVSKVQFITNKTSSVNSPSDLKEKKIGVRQSGQFSQIFADLFNNNADITVYNNMPDVIDALSKNKVDAIIINSASAQYWYANNDEQYKLLGDPIPLGMGFGIVARSGQEQLIGQLNQALQNMVSDGTYAKIYAKYFN